MKVIKYFHTFSEKHLEDRVELLENREAYMNVEYIKMFKEQLNSYKCNTLNIAPLYSVNHFQYPIFFIPQHYKICFWAKKGIFHHCYFSRLREIDKLSW